jgi:hypothetical protein
MPRPCRLGNGVQIQTVRRSLHIEEPPACRGRNEGHPSPYQALRPAGGLICQASEPHLFLRVMPDESLPLVPLAGSQLARHGSGGGRILDDMVSSTLTTSQQESALISRCRIGNIDFCESDYRQMLLWANVLNTRPDEVLLRLLDEVETLCRWRLGPSYEAFNSSFIRQGRLKRVFWQFEKLPLGQFRWVEGLEIEALRFVNESPSGSLDIRLESLLAMECGRCGLKKLKFESCSNLRQLACTGNQLTELDLSAAVGLKELSCESNKLNEIGISLNAELETLDCTWNKLSELDLSNNPLLEELGCSYNNLSKLNVRDNSALRDLRCANNQLFSLDLSKARNLQKLVCSKNNLSELDLPSTTSLKHLYCSDNQLKHLDLRLVPELEELYCDYNRLTKLDIRPLRNLKSLLYDRGRTRLIQRSDQNF